MEQVILRRAKPWIKGVLKPPRPWKAEQVWLGGGEGGGWWQKEMESEGGFPST